MKANHLPKGNTSIPDVPEYRKKCLLTPPKGNNTMSEELKEASFQQTQPWALSLTFHSKASGSLPSVLAVSWGIGREVLCNYMSA